jgi:hypothetical protein
MHPLKNVIVGKFGNLGPKLFSFLGYEPIQNLEKCLNKEQSLLADLSFLVVVIAAIVIASAAIAVAAVTATPAAVSSASTS